MLGVFLAIAFYVNYAKDMPHTHTTEDLQC